MPESEEDLLLMRLLDEQYTRTPFYGLRKLVVFLEEQGYVVDRKRVRRLMRLMGLETIYPKPRLSLPGEQPVRYSYLLRGMSIDHRNQVWSCGAIRFAETNETRSGMASKGEKNP